MTNSEKFKDVFCLYATELWAMPNEDFVKWINAEYTELEPPPHPEREKTKRVIKDDGANDLISRKSALEGMRFSGGLEADGILYVPLRDVREYLRNLPSAQSEIVRCKDCRYVWNENGWDNLWCNRLTGSFSVEKDGGCSWGKI